MFVETSNGYINTDAIASLQQQVGGAYRLRWQDGMVNVITETDGDDIVQAIRAEAKAPQTPKRNTRKTTK